MDSKKKKIILSIIIIFFIFLYCFGEGATEGYTWANQTRKVNNKIISPKLNQGNGFLDYHSFRTLELIGIIGALLGTLLISVSLKKYLILIIGALFSGMSLIYERVLQYIDKGFLFEPHPPKYNILWFSIQSSNTIEIIIGIIGIFIIIYYFYSLLKSK